MNRFADYRIMVVSDHFTPVSKRTHTGEPAPFAWASRDDLGKGVEGIGFFEVNANESGLVFERGHELINDFLGFSLID
jgi:2,3-bisphosphoglycerate-independent phosphoglycerate mutase